MLCAATKQVQQGLSVNLGGGIFKKRLNENRYRCIILIWSDYCVYQYLFAKKDRENIDDSELIDFQKLVNKYCQLSENQIEKLIENGALMEICHDNKTKI